MDSDGYDDDVLDEDLMLALDQTQATASSTGTNARTESGGSLSQGLNGAQQARVVERRPSPLLNRRNEQSHWADAIDLDDLPSDAFDSTPARLPPQQAARRPPPPPSQTFRQSTLWGGTVADGSASRASQPRPNNRAYLADLPVEPPSHHALNSEAMQTWVYPMNLGPIRDYQFTIVKNALFNNTLVALPTGLGKTFIAASVILNFFRWTRDAKIIFVAPTKPLAAQQVEACLNIAGIPRSATTLLTGETKPVLREDQWETKRLFFMTPQTLQNDLSKGYADPKSIVLLVIDEAHRATGDYAYVKVIEYIRRFSTSFRVLALTATPGSTVEGVQEVIDNLCVSHVEIRTEESIDIRKYVHSRQIDRVVLEPSDEILRLKELFTQALKPLTDKISQLNIYYGRDPMSITSFGLMKARQDWMNGAGRHFNQGAKMMANSIFTILQSLAHSIKLLDFHGIRPFFDNLSSFRSEAEAKGEKGSKYKRQILNDSSFQEMMDIASEWLKSANFVGHPKMTHLCDTLLNHFMDAGAGSSTRVIVFSEYRDSAEEIVRVLNIHKPLISASLFVGQADSKKSEGMKQKQQIETIEKFRAGTFNVLVATSIGEEGLDIGQVDLIVCFDSSSSPIRMLQRMGRTGRKRAGKISLLLMKGKEEDSFIRAQDNYNKMQKLICEGSRFNFRHDMSSRIVPRDIRPEVNMKVVDIPIENTQDKSLPEPKARNARTKKPAKKKFHMPDGVETGFVTVSSMFGKQSTSKGKPQVNAATPEPLETDELASIPDARGLLLNSEQVSELDRLYRHLPVGLTEMQEIEPPNLSTQHKLQRVLRPTAHLKHGSYTKRWVKFFKSQSAATQNDPTPRSLDDPSSYLEIPVPSFAEDTDGEGDDAGTTFSSGRKRSLAPASKDQRQPVPKRQKSGSKQQQQPARRKSKQIRRASNFIAGSQALESGAGESSEEENSAENDDDDDDDMLSWISYAEEEGRLQEGTLRSSGTNDIFNSPDPSSSRRLGRSSKSSPPTRSSRGQDVTPSSPMPSLASLESPPPALRRRRPVVPGTQGTDYDDDLPSIDEIMNKTKPAAVAQAPPPSSGPGAGTPDDDDDPDDVVKRAPVRRARRAFVDDSESD